MNAADTLRFYNALRSVGLGPAKAWRLAYRR